MTGYESKKAAAIAKTIDEVNWLDHEPNGVTKPAQAAVREIKQLRETQQTIIAGALFDFMGWLTSRKERIVLSSANEASPAVDAIKDFAKMRGLSLDDAKVQDWNTAQPAQEPMDDVRGFLAARLTCWHRLTEKESDELVALFESQPEKNT